MSLRSLLFSSRQETSRPLIQALLELDIDVDHSADIFAAIRELTSRSFDLIVADLDDGPEAEFLLKTARELQINKNAIVFAVASNVNNRVSGPHNRTDLVLAKPLIPEQIKYSLLGCDRFLVAYMRGGADPARPVAQAAASLRRKPSVSVVVVASKRRTPAPRQ